MPWWMNVVWAIIAFGAWHHGYDRARERTNREWFNADKAKWDRITYAQWPKEKDNAASI